MTRSVTARSLVLSAALMCFVLLPAAASTVVIPNVNENTPGPSNQAFPYNWGQMRVQQVFAADQFQGLTGAITQLAFRIDESQGSPFTSGPINTLITLSHTNVQPTLMSDVFADNLGADVTVVYSGDLFLSSSGNGFDIVINLQNPFVYSGAQNLIVDYKVFGPANTTQFDAAGTALGEGGTPWTDRVWALDPNATTGSSSGDDGYVTQFTFGEPTPVQVSSWGAVKALYR